MTSAPSASTPPSPATIASSESQTGGESFLPSASEGGDQEDTFGRERSASQPSLKRNLSLNIPTQFAYTGNPLSPSSLLSQGAPFTDSGYPINYDPSQDYFQVADQGFLSAGADAPNAQFGYRLPASQPSSPVRTIYPPGQAPFFINGRQRGATFSGGSYNFEQFGGPLSSVIPNHLAFTQLQASPAGSLAASPIIPTAEASYFLATNSGVNPALPLPSGINAGLGMGDVLMEDVETPTVVPQLVPAPAQMPPAPAGTMTPDMSAEMADRLTLLDQIVNSATSAKNALLRGQQTEVSANLGQISTQLEVASELGVGPVPTPRDMTPGSTGVSPVQYSASPVATRPGVSPAMPVATPPLAHSSAPQQTPPHAQVQAPVPMVAMPMPSQGMPQQMQAQLVPQLQIPMSQSPSLLPPLPVESPMGHRPASINTSLTPNPLLAPAAGYASSSLPVPPPMVHSHSYPNGHQLPSQLHGLAAPTTPVVPSPSFAAQLGIQHAPLISSPLASVPVSRPTTPPNNRPYPIPEQPWAESAAMAGEMPLPMSRNASDMLQHRRPSDGIRNDGRPVINRNRSTSVTKNRSVPNMTASVPPSAWQSRHGSPDGDDEDDESDDDGRPRTKRRRSSAGAEAPELGSTSATISEDIRRQLDTIFEEFLSKVCSDLDFVDSKREKLHQVLMPKKMARLDESTDYRPFKFRIQAFTNAFHEELQNRGITEETMSVKKVKTYLWRQDLISRFNADGKKAKSKGNHIWNVDAKKLPGGGWVFRPFKRRIIGQPQAFALVGHRYEWEPKIWDPQAASDTIKPTFYSPHGSLPAWLGWDETGKLVGVPEQPTGPISITAIAEFTDAGGAKQTLETSFNVQAVSPSLVPMSDPRAMYAQGYTPWTSEYPPEAMQPLQPGLMYQSMNGPVPMPLMSLPMPRPGAPPYPYPNGA